MLVAHCDGGCDRYFENAGPALVIQQNTRKIKALDDTVDDCVSAFTLALDTQAMPATNQLVHNSFGKVMLDLEAQRVILKSGYCNGFDVRGELAPGHRLVAFGKAANEQQNHQ